LEKHIIKIIVVTALLSTTLIAQTDSVNATPDTSQYKFVMQKSPLGAVLRSAVIPGWGQIYNQSYWKAPVIWGFIGYYLYYWIRNNNSYINYGNLYRQSLKEKSENSSYYFAYRNFYHDQRDLFTIYIGIVYLLNLLDAYVDAQLFDFDISEVMYGTVPRLNFRLHF
jgi:hypothetical protein